MESRECRVWRRRRRKRRRKRRRRKGMQEAKLLP